MSMRAEVHADADIGAGVNAMSWLRTRPRLFMMQIVIAEKAAMICGTARTDRA
jgi:hypothetical protein